MVKCYILSTILPIKRYFERYWPQYGAVNHIFISCVANNLLEAFALIKKFIEKGIVSEEDEFDHNLKPLFYVLLHTDLEIAICGKEFQMKASTSRSLDIPK